MTGTGNKGRTLCIFDTVELEIALTDMKDLRFEIKEFCTKLSAVVDPEICCIPAIRKRHVYIYIIECL